MDYPKSKTYNNPANLTFAAILMLSIALLYQFRWSNGKGKEILHYDGKGYYRYLTAIFQDNSIKNLESSAYYTNEEKGRNFIKYAPGVALLQTPFYAAGIVCSKIFNTSTDGYSVPSQIMVSLASLFYLFLGLFLLYKTLRLYGISEWSSLIAITAIYLGTNLLFYAIVRGDLSHCYTFGMVGGWAYSLKMYSKENKAKYLYLSAFFLGVTALIRPTNAMIAITAPFFIREDALKLNLKAIISYLNNYRRQIIIAGILFLSIILIQPILWYFQTGQFLVRTYKGEGFYFLNPQFWDVLFSFRRGIFLYTPLLLLSLFGFFYIKNKNKFFIGILFIIGTYLISCWWIWDYSDGIGNRAFIDFYPFAAILLGFLLQYSNTLLKKYIIPVLLASFIFLNINQCYQFEEGIMHPFSMTAKQYSYIFLRWDKSYKDALGGWDEMPVYSNNREQMILTKNDFEKYDPNWNNGIVSESKDSKSGKYSDYSGNEFNTTFEYPLDSSLYQNTKNLYAIIHLSRFEINAESTRDARIIVDVKDQNDQSTYYQGIKINPTPSNKAQQWEEFKYAVNIPLRGEIKKLLIYIWNPQKESFYIDDFQIDLYNLKNKDFVNP